jgi:hypothetical protein
MNPLDILKRTPKTNCGQCGYPACLAFAANVAKSGADPTKCPYIDLDGLDLGSQQTTGLEEMSREHDLELVRHLQDKISGLDFAKIAPKLGADWSKLNPDTLEFLYLGQSVKLSKNGILLAGREPEDPRDQILLYNYVHSGGGEMPENNWIGLESLPNSISKVKTLARYGEERICEIFSQVGKEEINRICQAIPHAVDPESSADAAIIFQVLPRLPQYVLFWEEDREDGFPARVKILFDKEVMDFLDLESLVFSAERLADRLAVLVKTE